MGMPAQGASQRCSYRQICLVAPQGHPGCPKQESEVPGTEEAWLQWGLWACLRQDRALLAAALCWALILSRLS